MRYIYLILFFFFILALIPRWWGSAILILSLHFSLSLTKFLFTLHAFISSLVICMFFFFGLSLYSYVTYLFDYIFIIIMIDYNR